MNQHPKPPLLDYLVQLVINKAQSLNAKYTSNINIKEPSSSGENQKRIACSNSLSGIVLEVHLISKRQVVLSQCELYLCLYRLLQIEI